MIVRDHNGLRATTELKGQQDEFGHDGAITSMLMQYVDGRFSLMTVCNVMEPSTGHITVTREHLVEMRDMFTRAIDESSS